MKKDTKKEILDGLPDQNKGETRDKLTDEEWIQAIVKDPHSCWKTPSQYFSYIRNTLRRASSRNPLKTNWKRANLKPITPTQRSSGRFHRSTKFVGMCVICRKMFAGSHLEVDHKTHSSCVSKTTAEGFMWHCLGTTTDQYQLLCKPCHKIKSNADNKGITFEESKGYKKAIVFSKRTVARQKELLTEWGYPDELNNAKSRRAAAFKHYMKE